MMEILQDFSDNVLAVKAYGRVTRRDYEEVLIPAANNAFQRHSKLRVYYEMAPDFAGFDAGAMWEDFTYGIGHLTRWEKVAVVTDVDWIRHATNFFRIFMPCPTSVFALSEAAKAHVWITE